MIKQISIFIEIIFFLPFFPDYRNNTVLNTEHLESAENYENTVTIILPSVAKPSDILEYLLAIISPISMLCFNG